LQVVVVAVETQEHLVAVVVQMVAVLQIIGEYLLALQVRLEP
jgi:hypothetical protein